MSGNKREKGFGDYLATILFILFFYFVILPGIMPAFEQQDDFYKSKVPAQQRISGHE